jgi:hypothetical protein
LTVGSVAITLTAIGSCRVREPTRVLVRRGLAEQNQRGVFGATHTSKEVLQVLRSMAGELIVPAELRPYIATRPASLLDDPRTRLNDMSDTDVLIVELSSVKEILFRDFYLQLFLTARCLRATGSKPVLEWWELMRRNGTDVDDRSRLVASVDPSSLEAAVVAEVQLRMQEPDDIGCDMELITDMVEGPILFVTHFDTPRPDGRKNVRGRSDLIAAVREAAAELGYRMYDPTADVLSYAAERGDLTAAITDIGHYTDAFVEDFLADKLHAEALAAMGTPAAV